MKRLTILLGLLGAALFASPSSVPLHAAPGAHPGVASNKTSVGRSSLVRHRRRSYGGRRHYRRMHLPKAPTRDRIGEIQAGLARSGYYEGEPNGRWDASTVDAMKRFQQAQGLAPTGKIDALTLQKLGLGSDIAGVSAPKPIPPSSAPASTPHE